MRCVNLLLAVATCLAPACLGQVGRAAGGQAHAQANTRPGEKAEAPKTQVKLPFDEPAVRFSAREFAAWPQQELDGRSCRVSPVIDAPVGYELNHHRVTVNFTGTGSVALSLAHSRSGSLAKAIDKSGEHSPFRALKSGRETRISSPYPSERFAWLILQTSGQVEVTEVRHSCWRGRGTLYGHLAGSLSFAGGKLPYRLMLPKDYDPGKSYPLVLSVHGSGGVGTDNVGNMEMVILGRRLFTDYYDDEQLACFSLVPQIVPEKAIPEPYWPQGPKGGPTPVYHPDWPLVNEQGWYVQATLALIHSLIQHEYFNVDPDRVYYTGFSYGGKGCWEFLKAGREVFAAAMCAAGWAVGPVFCDPTGRLTDRLKLEVQRYKHIPVQVFAGQQDPLRLGSLAVHKEIHAQGGKSSYVEFPKTGHIASAGKTWGNRAHVQWLFQQNRKSNPKPGEDPFPGGTYPPQGP